MWLVVFLYFLFLISSHAEFSRSEILRVCTDPATQVDAGGSVIVTLTLMDSRRSSHWLGNSKEEFDFFITALPRHGRLSEIQQFSRESDSDQAQVVYTHIPGADFETEDIFSFEARNKRGEHLAGLARISILQPHLEIKPLKELSFGNLVADEKTTQRIQLKNSSQVTIRGNLGMNEPFFCSDLFYEILPHSEKLIEIKCQTSKPGFYRSKLQFSSFPETDYYLQATVLTPLIFLPEELDLGVQLRRGDSREKIEKVGEIELYNRGSTSKKVRLHIQTPFQIFPKELAIPARSKRTIVLQANPNCEGIFKIKIMAISDQATASAKIKLNWFEKPHLELRSSSDLGRVEQKTTRSLVWVNPSQLPWQGNLSVPAPFFLLNTNLILKAGESQAISLVFDPPFPSKFEKKLILTEQTTRNRQLFPIKAEGLRSRHFPSTTNLTGLKEVPVFLSQSQFPQFSLTGLFYRMSSPEIAIIKWKTSDVPTNYRLYQKQWIWNSDKTKVLEKWHWVEDVGCQTFDKNMVGFHVDRLRPNWRYIFAVYQVDSNSQVIAISRPFEIVTPLATPASKSHLWIVGGLGLAFAIFGFFKKYQFFG